MEGRRPWQRSARFEQRKKKKSEGRRKEKEEEDAGEREELAARMRMAKEAVRHGRGRASRTALAGGAVVDLATVTTHGREKRREHVWLDILDSI